MKKLLTLIMMFLLVGPSIAFSMEETDLNGLNDNDYLEFDIDEEEYPEDEFSSMFVETTGDEDEGDTED